MAVPTTLSGTKLLIEVGDGASPETFAHPCLINSQRGITFTANGNKIEVPDCASPDDPAWTEFTKQSLECTLDGAGVMDNVAATIQSYSSWLASATGKNIKIYIGTVGHWTGVFHLTKFALTGNRGGKIEVSLQIDSDGAVTWASP